MIQLNDVTKQYKTSNGPLTAVDQVNLKIQDGEIFGIIGYSGAGKSTMIRLFNGLEKPTSGSVIVNGEDISKIKGAKLRNARHKISMVFQHFNLLWSRTVEDNIAFSLEVAGVKKEARKKKVAELIELVGLTGREKAYPSQLSGGQKQRVGIARALANDPEVLLCDEATSALDPETTDAILDLLRSVNEKLNITIILITHEMHVIRKICNRVAVMEAGKVVEQGDVLQVFESPKALVTQKFVQQVTDTAGHKESIQQMKEQYSKGKLIKLFFVGSTTEQPIITKLIRQFEVEVNIVHGNISPTKSGPYGTLIVQIAGSDEEVEKAVIYLAAEGIKSEVLTHE
ncbi:methionine import ATP-binding protein MetN [Kurthia zopfii]|uniref:D-methionine transport system ATP-binding protein n=1 Tax=Kurthia zopfii TaxID=1650 RepID=A0A8B4QCN6_9BACL|nr:methionine ABC transporter ATP-binding protein [Kurthia zopfii]PWI23633.1 methionine ABC transporter ATP-binding protein [Kurthia zopfii]TDR42686.1 D-methionine transport system ATP-binding protein [Kurthia zopfii]GEK30158.1 methionine import ATP-binding protein MetN [Kurthia zopfii]STX10477.1 Methionine import ATP-binding protein MetN [Kurthia zopfii]